MRNGVPVKVLKGNLGRMWDLHADRDSGGREFVKLLAEARVRIPIEFGNDRRTAEGGDRGQES